jgi:hypothetical protein
MVCVILLNIPSQVARNVSKRSKVYRRLQTTLISTTTALCHVSNGTVRCHCSPLFDIWSGPPNNSPCSPIPLYNGHSTPLSCIWLSSWSYARSKMRKASYRHKVARAFESRRRPYMDLLVRRSTTISLSPRHQITWNLYFLRRESGWTTRNLALCCRFREPSTTPYY